MFFKQIIDKLRNPHIVNLIGNAVMSVLNMVLIAIFFRYLSMDEMGIWFFFQGTIGLIDTFRAGLITTAFITSYAGNTEERSREIAGSAWYLGSGITVVFIVINLVYLLLPYRIPDGGTDLFIKWFGLVYVITLPSFIASCIAQAEQRFDRLLYIRAVSQILSIVFALVMILTNHVTLMMAVYTGFLAGGIASLMTIMLGWARIDTFKNYSKKTIRHLFDFGKYSVGTSLGSSMFRNSDTYIINFMLGPGSLAVYNLGLRLMEFVETPLRSFAATIMPPLSAAHNQDNKPHVIYILKKYAGMVTIVILPIVIGSLLFSEFAVWIVDKKYVATAAPNVFRIFMTFALLYPVERFMALTLDATNQPQVNAVKLIFMLAANIIGDVLGVLIFHNVYGVALATLLPVVVGLLISYFRLQKYSKFNLLDVYRIGYLETFWLIRDSIKAFKNRNKKVADG
ncbi:oligosaccharide flippase family protein [Mucilaginibacter sp. RS28]|uniref:Oligosaccharide flippase family protein n=1 Tax=Mucilaginibacter straminoryzae TaxID=2932774 RepID=A0A9X1X4S9_9SPHI|nr:oligosaccharide flippase family protein [Mucilaginibacter straminoryzae]MCJ8210410.1 oligosaccharide flippase family protein [Mucilaginibacter straminoryzae]